MSGDDYIKNAVREVETKLSAHGRTLYKGTKSPVKVGYHPELDTSPVLDDDGANYYQGLIGVLRWAIELGRIDILLEGRRFLL